MDVLFMKGPSNPFSRPPMKKSFYCPTTPRSLDKDERKVCLSWIRPLPCPLPPGEGAGTHWDVKLTPNVTQEPSSSSPSSSKFDESWPSTEGGSPGGGAGGGVKGKGEELGDDSTLAQYIYRFRHAPPTCRTDRPKPDRSFWWRDHTHLPHPPEITPPKAPTHQSTPTSAGRREEEEGREEREEGRKELEEGREDRRKEGEGTPPASLKLNVSSEGIDSLQERSQDAIDKSSSLLTSSTVSSLPAQKYLNTRHRVDGMPSVGRASDGALPRPLRDPLQELPLDHEGEGDILQQWRLRRRLERARREAEVMAEEGRVYPGENQPGVRGDLSYGGRRRGHGRDGRGRAIDHREGDGASVQPEADPREGIDRRFHLSSARHNFECSHGGVTIVPPAAHHLHLSTPSHHTLLPHTHTACDIIPCPCCNTGGTATRAQARPRGVKKPTLAAWREGRGTMSGAGNGGWCERKGNHGVEQHRPSRKHCSSCYDHGGAEVDSPVIQAFGKEGSGARIHSRPHHTSEESRPAIPLSEGEISSPQLEPAEPGCRSSVMTPGDQTGSSGRGTAPGPIDQATRSQTVCHGDSSLLDGAHLPGLEVKGTREEERQEEGRGGEGRGGEQPSVRYPSPSLLTRLRSQRPGDPVQPGGPTPPQPSQLPRRGSLASEEDSHSLTLSTDFDLSLTPVRPDVPVSRAASCDRRTNGGGGGERGNSSGDGEITIGPLVLEAVERHLCGSPLHPPPPSSPTCPRTPNAGLVTSKCLGGPLPCEVSPPDAEWSEEGEDGLLNALIRKARVFEAELREIDRLLVALEAD